MQKIPMKCAKSASVFRVRAVEESVHAAARSGPLPEEGAKMNVLVRFLDEYATAILYAGITAFAGAAGVVLKRIGSRYFSNRTKRRVVRNCIRAVERVYGDLPEDCLLYTSRCV